MKRFDRTFRCFCCVICLDQLFGPYEINQILAIRRLLEKGCFQRHPLGGERFQDFALAMVNTKSRGY